MIKEKERKKNLFVRERGGLQINLRLVAKMRKKEGKINKKIVSSL